MLRIRDWSKTFENAESRKLVNLRWFNCPAGIDSNGYIELMSYGEAGLLAFGVFQAICQWSATRRPETRGRLVRNDGSPLNERQLATHLRIDISHLSPALELLKSPAIQWILDESDDAPTTDLPPISHSSPPIKEERNHKGGEGRGEDIPRARPTDVKIPECLDDPGFLECWHRFVAYYREAPENHSGRAMPFQTQTSNLMELSRRFADGGLDRCIADLELSIRVSKVGNLQDSTKCHDNGHVNGKKKSEYEI